MSLVNVTSVDVRNNPSSLNSPFGFEVVFECLEPLDSDLEWKLIYVGSADDKALDQELDCVVMGPIHRGALKFTFEADAPDFTKIPPEDIHGFTIILLTGSYRDEEFIRIGWYVHNVYVDQELQDDPPDVPDMSKMQRIILTEAPRVTRFKISWDRPKFDECSSTLDTIVENDVMADPNDTSMDTVHSGMSVGSGMGQHDKTSAEFPNNFSNLNSGPLDLKYNVLQQNSGYMGGLPSGMGHVSQNLSSGMGNVSQNLSSGMGNVSQNLSSGMGHVSQNLSSCIGHVPQGLFGGMGHMSQNFGRRMQQPNFWHQSSPPMFDAADQNIKSPVAMGMMSGAACCDSAVQLNDVEMA